jgi:tetratricopeptide (TPR) repeat protein
MDKQHEKAMLDLQRLLKTQKFKNPEEAQAFLKEYLEGKKIPEFDKEALTPEEQAQDLVYQAIEEESLIEADQLVFMALLHDPNCAEAYEYLADMSGSPLQSLMFFKNGMEAARRKLGETFFAENKGHFWGMHETRPFMRCAKGYAECLSILEQIEPALNVLFELLELNPNDNQGVRDLAELYCIKLGKNERYLNLHNKYKGDVTAFHAFNFALYNFVKYGDSSESRAALSQACAKNSHVLKLMISKKMLPEISGGYSLGQKDEAIYYCSVAKLVWQEIPGAIDWLGKVYLGK